MIGYFRSGGRGGVAREVTRDGIALVRSGERIYPREADRAESVAIAEDGEETVHVYFPVEIEIRRVEAEPLDPDAAAGRALARVARYLRNSA